MSVSCSSSLLLCKFDTFCNSKGLNDSQIDKEAIRFFAWAISKGYMECLFPEYLAGYAKGEWCQFDGWSK
jgi:hypothetical protein